MKRLPQALALLLLCLVLGGAATVQSDLYHRLLAQLPPDDRPAEAAMALLHTVVVPSLTAPRDSAVLERALERAELSAPMPYFVQRRRPAGEGDRSFADTLEFTGWYDFYAVNGKMPVVAFTAEGSGTDFTANGFGVCQPDDILFDAFRPGEWRDDPVPIHLLVTGRDFLLHPDGTVTNVQCYPGEPRQMSVAFLLRESNKNWDWAASTTNPHALGGGDPEAFQAAGD